MSEKKVKTNSDNIPKTKDLPKVKGKSDISKVAVKTKEAAVNTAKDVKSMVKNAAIKKAVESKLGTDDGYQQPKKVDTEAAESVEHAAYATGGAVYHKAKNFTNKRINDIKNRVKTKENENETPEKDGEELNKEKNESNGTHDNKEHKSDNKAQDKPNEKSKVKTKEEYLKSQRNSETNTSSKGVKTKENYIKDQSVNNMSNKESAVKEARKEYVSNKLKEKSIAEKIQNESSAPRVDVKTKDSYIQSLNDRNVKTVKTPNGNTPKFGNKISETTRHTFSSKKSLKTRANTVEKATSAIKKGSVYASETVKKNAVKTAKNVVKTPKSISKKVATKTAKQAKRVAQKAVETAKKATKAVKNTSAKVASVAVKVMAKLVSALAALGGGAVLVVILLVIIAIAAIVSSPFSIFFSDDASETNGIPLSSIVNECNMELSQKLTDIEDGTPHDRIVMEGEQADWSLVISIFSVKLAGREDDSAEDVAVIDESKKQKLKEVFWDMHSISSRTESVSRGDTTATVLYITINTKTKEEMISQYGFSRNQKEALETLLENASALTASTQSLAISDTTAKEIIEKLPDDLPEERKRVVKKASSLVGKLTYFWGGKSEVVGWDSEWGKMKLVTSEGSRSTGCMRPFGLDCSGFVTWSFINAGYSASAIGHGTLTQVSKGTRISLSSAQPGDLAFYDDKSHVGIVGGKDNNGNILVIHCSSGANNVVITTGGFGFAVRPNCY